MLPSPRQMHCVIWMLFVGSMFCSSIRDRFLKQSDCFQMGT